MINQDTSGTVGVGEGDGSSEFMENSTLSVQVIILFATFASSTIVSEWLPEGKYGSSTDPL
jgi:hypothetical protein